MTPRLRITIGPDKGRDFPLTATAPLIVGRAPSTDARLSDKAVSSVHCQFFVENGQVSVLDLGSKFGTFVNGQRVTQATLLKAGDVIHIGDTQIVLQTADEMPLTVAEQAGVPTASTAARKPTRRTVLPPDRLQELAGQKLANFQVGTLLARGENGLVFRAQSLKDNQPVALKVFWPEFAQDEEDVQRFIRAMKTLMPLKHPHLVTVRGAGKSGPYCWIATDLIEGDSLAQIMVRFGKGNAMSWQLPLRVGAHVCRALVFIHHHQILHRDITPSNILVRSSDQAALLGDALTAKAAEGKQAVSLTRPGELPGDVRFMSPERTSGGVLPVDARTDLYGLGATMYTICTGRPPLEGKNFVQTVMKIQQEAPAPVRQFQPAVPPAFEALILRLLAKRPDDRPPTAVDLLGQMEALARTLGVPT